MIVAELESVFTATDRDHAQTADRVEARNRRLDGERPTVQVDANVADALGGLDRVEGAGQRLEGLNPEVEVDADTSSAEDAIKGLADEAERSGSEGGARGGDALVGGIVGALATIPIAGAVVGIAKAAADAVVQGFEDGLAVEVREDVFSARTGLDAATAARFGAAAGEAYASNWGESIEANMDTARQAVQSGLLDPDATQRDAQQIIESLSGVADVLGEDIPAVTRSAQQLLRTGLARDASEAFDIIVRGQQAGLNVSEDWLDTLDEYSVQWQKLGLDGGQVLGLLSQGVQAGARDTDIAADALKEFSIRAIDDSALTKEGFDAIGLSAEEMAAKIAEGGPEAADALDQTLDALRKIEDPAKRNAAAVALFGTQAEDLGAALFAMDLDTAAQGFENLDGAAARALNTLGDNTAGTIASAQRSIEVAADGIKGALAEAFAPQIEGFANFVSENREAVTSFLFDAGEGAIDFGIAIVEGAAAGTEAIGDFLGGPVADLIDATADLAVGFDRALPGDQDSQAFREWADEAIAGLGEADDSLEDLAETTRSNLIDNALTPAQEKLSDLRIPAEASARLSDTSKRLAGAIGAVGYEADGSRSSLRILNGEVDTGTEAGRRLDKQIQGVSDSLHDQVRAAADAGESQASLRDRASQARQAFLDQAQALGITRRDAKRLADQYGLIPSKIVTEVVADTSSARSTVESFIQDMSGRTVAIAFNGRLGVEARAAGGPVWPGQDFLVGEEGPELVRFSQAGTVVPAAQTAQALSAPAYQSSAPSMGDIHITHYGGTDAAIERGVERAHQKRELLRAGGGA